MSPPKNSNLRAPKSDISGILSVNFVAVRKQSIVFLEKGGGGGGLP